jgi:hypothetical protein
VAFEIYSSGAPTLWTARTSGAGAHALIADGARPAYSPDGRTLARQSPDIGPSELFLVRQSGGRERRLALGGSAGSPDRQPLPRGR